MKNTTAKQIREFLEEPRNLKEEQLISLVKSKGIPKRAFLNEYQSNTQFGSDVAIETATQYFKELRDRLEPTFIQFRKDSTDKEIYFHLSEAQIKETIRLVKKEGKPK